MLVASLLASGGAGTIANQAEALTEGQSVQNTSNHELTLKPGHELMCELFADAGGCAGGHGDPSC
jgi:hypothetical protein